MKRLNKELILSAKDDILPAPEPIPIKQTIQQSKESCVTGKKTYPTVTDAVKAQRLMKKKHKGMRWYKCTFCGQYHLTSNSGRRKGK